MAHDEFIHPIGADGTTDDNSPPLLDDWQIQGVISFLRILVQKAHEGEQPLPVTPLAEMITTYGPALSIWSSHCEELSGGDMLTVLIRCSFRWLFLGTPRMFLISRQIHR